MEKEPTHYIVESNPRDWPTEDHLAQGYETEWEYNRALQDLNERWRGRIGEKIGVVHGFVILRFHDTPGGRPDEAKMPRFLLRPIEPPSGYGRKKREETELDKAFEFD